MVPEPSRKRRTTWALPANYEKAEGLATSAAEAEGVANRPAMQAVDSYRHHAEKVAGRKAEAEAEEAAQAAKHEAKAAAKR